MVHSLIHRLLGPRPTSTGRCQTPQALLLHEGMAPRPLIHASDGHCVHVVATELLQCPCPLSHYRASESPASIAAPFGMVRPHGNGHRIPERVPDLQSGARHPRADPLECVPVLCHQLRTGLWQRQLGVQPERATELDIDAAVHLQLLLVHPYADHNRRDAHARE